jgi:hypothetical protein
MHILMDVKDHRVVFTPAPRIVDATAE